MAKRNCWKAKGCGRDIGGRNEALLGVCPAATTTALDGINGGRNAGRACWTVAGTLCSGDVQGTYATKIRDCMTCSFYAEVMVHEGAAFQTGPAVLGLLS